MCFTKGGCTNGETVACSVSVVALEDIAGTDVLTEEGTDGEPIDPIAIVGHIAEGFEEPIVGEPIVVLTVGPIVGPIVEGFEERTVALTAVRIGEPIAERIVGPIEERRTIGTDAIDTVVRFDVAFTED